MDGAYRPAASQRKRTASARQFGASREFGQPSALEHVDKRLHEERLNRVQLHTAHAHDFLDHVLPIDRVVGPLARSEPTQQLPLALGPQQNIIVV
jgi:hypothetical protein